MVLQHDSRWVNFMRCRLRFRLRRGIEPNNCAAATCDLVHAHMPHLISTTFHLRTSRRKPIWLFKLEMLWKSSTAGFSYFCTFVPFGRTCVLGISAGDLGCSLILSMDFPDLACSNECMSFRSGQGSNKNPTRSKMHNYRLHAPAVLSCICKGLAGN